MTEGRFALVYVAIAVMLGLWLLFVGVRPVFSQEPSHWAYTLTDQNEDEVLALRTQWGTFRVMRTEDFGCGMLEANANVLTYDWQVASVVVVPDNENWAPACTVLLIAQVDEAPCFTNEHGDCDVIAENG